MVCDFTVQRRVNVCPQHKQLNGLEKMKQLLWSIKILRSVLQLWMACYPSDRRIFLSLFRLCRWKTQNALTKHIHTKHTAMKKVDADHLTKSVCLMNRKTHRLHTHTCLGLKRNSRHDLTEDNEKRYKNEAKTVRKYQLEHRLSVL